MCFLSARNDIDSKNKNNSIIAPLRRSDSNSRPNVRPAAGVPDHRVSKKQAERRSEECDGEWRKTCTQTRALRRGGKGNAKVVRAFPGVTESTVRCLQNFIFSCCTPDRWTCHSIRASPPPGTTCYPRRGC